MTAATAGAHPTGTEHVLHGLRQGVDLILSGNAVLVDTTLRTLLLAGVATAAGALLGVPLGGALGLGRSRPARLLRGMANGLTRVPPVVSGLFVLLILTEASPWGGGPLAGLHWFDATPAGYLAQTVLAVPIMVTLTAAGVQAVAPGLLAQARAYGAPRRAVLVLAVREARWRVLGAVLVTLGVAITSVGAIVVSSAPQNVTVASGNAGGRLPEPATLALGAFNASRQAGGSGTDTDAAPARVAASLGYPTQALAVAYATVLMGLFVLLAALLTRRRLGRGRPFAT